MSEALDRAMERLVASAFRVRVIWNGVPTGWAEPDYALAVTLGRRSLPWLPGALR